MPNRPTTAADCKRLLEEALAEVVTAADLTASLDALAGHLFAEQQRLEALERRVELLEAATKTTPRTHPSPPPGEEGVALVHCETPGHLWSAHPETPDCSSPRGVPDAPVA